MHKPLEMSVALIETRARTEMATHTRMRPPISLNSVINRVRPYVNVNPIYIYIYIKKTQRNIETRVNCIYRIIKK